MTEFEQWISSVGSDRSINFATYFTKLPHKFLFCHFS